MYIVRNKSHIQASHRVKTLTYRNPFHPPTIKDRFKLQRASLHLENIFLDDPEMMN